VVLILMVGLTGWALSTVSIWLVPVYVGIMVLLLGSPQETRPEGFGTTSDAVNERAVSAPPSPSPVEDVPANPPESANSGPKGAGPRAVKPRSSRSRSRKSAAKGGAEANSVPAPATWIRIGPGKFVRADADSGILLDAVAEIGAGHVDPVVEPPPSSPTDSEIVPELETEPGCQGIAPSALGSLACSELSPIPVSMMDAVPTSPPASLAEAQVEVPADSAADVPTDLVADVDRDIPPDRAIGEIHEVEPDAKPFELEGPSVEAVPEGLVDDRHDTLLPDAEVRLDDDLRPDRPIPAEDPRASGADEDETAPADDDREVEQSPPVSEDRTESSLDSRHVPSRRTAPLRPLFSRQRPRRAVRDRDAVDFARRSRSGVPRPNSRDRSPLVVSQLRDASLRTTGRTRRIRRGYRPRSPPSRCGGLSPGSDRIA
jgi:hypothetical protein